MKRKRRSRDWKEARSTDVASPCGWPKSAARVETLRVGPALRRVVRPVAGLRLRPRRPTVAVAVLPARGTAPMVLRIAAALRVVVVPLIVAALRVAAVLRVAVVRQIEAASRVVVVLRVVAVRLSQACRVVPVGSLRPRPSRTSGTSASVARDPSARRSLGKRSATVRVARAIASAARSVCTKTTSGRSDARPPQCGGRVGHSVANPATQPPWRLYV